MRISDWSSDVCSSDLGRSGGAGGAVLPRRLSRRIPHPRRPGPEPLRRRAEAGGASAAGLAARRLRLPPAAALGRHHRRSEEHTSELQSLMRLSFAVFCLKKKTMYLIVSAFSIF